MGIGEIIITQDIQQEIDNILQDSSNAKVFYQSDFNMDSAKEALEESFISSPVMKNIIIAGDTFNIFAQNALLKALEEPPQNIHFILITKSKNGILPTIISRMIVRKKNTKKILPDFELDLKNLRLENITEFIENIKITNKEETRDLVQSLLFSARRARLNLQEKELQYFNRALQQIEHYESPKYILLQLLLMILEHKRRNCAKEIQCLSKKSKL